MNIFIIPSWYPSESNPIYGIFNQEQAHLLAKERPNFNIGVSKWGQGDERLLLPLLSFDTYRKVYKSYLDEATIIRPNLTEYFSPAFTWTRKVFKGNIEGIYRANLENLNKYMNQYGKPDIICAQSSYPASIIAQRMARELQIPYIVTIYMSPFPFKEFLKGGYLKKLISNPLKGASRLLSSCHALESTMKEHGLRGISVIPLPTDTDYFEPPSKPINKSKISMLSVGRVEEQKGFDLLLKAVAQLDNDFELRIGGDGSLINEYKTLASTLKISEKVVWLGLLNKEEVLKEMQACSFYILPSRHETFGIVQVEAMACGKPVVATKCGGPEDIIIEDVGILCNNNDIDDLRKSILTMIKTYKNYSSELIRSVAVTKFGHKAWVDRIEVLFKEVLSK